MEEDRKDSGEEQRDEDEGLGPRSNISLLDQHQHLKEKAEGMWILHILHCNLLYMLLLLYCKVDMIQRCLTCVCA